jgi:transposase
MLSYNVKIDEIALQMQATRSTENDLVIVVSNSLSEPNLLVIYAKRWRIECLFANLKSKGFNLEDTHFTAKDRIGNLTKLIVLALTICYLIGLVKASYKPIMLKKHGYKQSSFFRYGYDLLIQKLNNNLYDAIKLISLCISYLPMEVKCKKLISVM